MSSKYEKFEFWEIWALAPDVKEKTVLLSANNKNKN